jgi:hypothetical protein
MSAPTMLPTMLPTMRYDPDRAVVWVWPDRDAPFLVTRHAIEDLTGSRGLSADELIDACEEHAAYFAQVAVRKLVRRDVDPDGRAVVMALDVHT